MLCFFCVRTVTQQCYNTNSTIHSSETKNKPIQQKTLSNTTHNSIFFFLGGTPSLFRRRNHHQNQPPIPNRKPPFGRLHRIVSGIRRGRRGEKDDGYTIGLWLDTSDSWGWECAGGGLWAYLWLDEDYVWGGFIVFRWYVILCGMSLGIWKIKMKIIIETVFTVCVN